MSVRMTSDEAWEFVAAAHTGILTTLRADGFPISLPVWFIVDQMPWNPSDGAGSRPDRPAARVDQMPWNPSDGAGSRPDRPAARVDQMPWNPSDGAGSRPDRPAARVEDQTVLVSGPAQTKKFARIRHDDRCSFLVEAGEQWAELRAVHLTGRAELVEDPDWARLDPLFDAKYASFRTPSTEMPSATREHYGRGRSLAADPSREARVLTWDNRRLGASG